MNVKIIADPSGVQVLSADGHTIAGVSEILWRSARDDVAEAQITLLFVELETHARAKFIGPNGKEVTRIEYADGSVEDYGV